MRQALKDMLGSKKAVAMIAGLIVSFAGKYGLELPTEELIAVLSPLIAYIFSQGLADIGKERAKVDAQPPPNRPASS